MSDRFDVVVVGAGPAGIAAAVSAAESAARVALLDENPAAGGQIWRKGSKQPQSARSWLTKLNSLSVTRLQGWHAFGHPAPGVLLVERNNICSSGSASDRLELHYEKLVLATGARERFLPFPGWTLPNVMGAGGLDAMSRGGLPVHGKRVVVAGSGPLLLAVAAHLAQRGAKIPAICEQAQLHRLVAFAAGLITEPGKLGQGIRLRFTVRGARFYTGCWPVMASGTGKVETVTLQRNGRRWDVACDYLACGYHLVPNLELPELIGCRIRNGFVAVDDFQQTSVPGVFCAGEPTGIGGVELAILEGSIAGLAATGRSNEVEALGLQKARGRRFMRALEKTFDLNPRLRGLPSDQTIVCRCEDIRFGALRECTSAREAKLHTRCGMGPCQGRICGAAAQFLFGWAWDSARLPILPVQLASLGSDFGMKSGRVSMGNRKDRL
jgi:NADPH-dependent 2,4-dienoyl-CoA reductase/sulfur reductase-like enzyme